MTMDIHALVGAYVLDAVDDIERAAFDRHLQTCRACSAEVDELRETAARLADGTWSVPPPRLRHEVMARVAVTRQVSPPGVYRPARQDRSTARPWGRRLVAAAAAVVLAAGTGTAVFAWQQEQVRDQRTAAASARAETERIQRVLGASDVRLRQGDVEGGGRVTVAVSESQDAGVVVLDGGAAPGVGKAYQLWLLEGANPVPAGVLPADAGSGRHLISSVGEADTLALTIEPAGGSRTPTLPIRAAVEF